MIDNIRSAGISLPALRRLPHYYRIMEREKANGSRVISSQYLADQLGYEGIQVRKDLSGLGITGLPRMGFPLDEIMAAIRVRLGWDNVSDAFLVGAGNLGSALAGYRHFEDWGLRIVALFDSSPSLVGSVISGKPVFGMDRLADLTGRMHVALGILTVPPEAAEKVCADMVAAGIRGIWNFTGVRLQVPANVVVEPVNLASSLAVLSARIAIRDEKSKGDMR